MVGVERGGRLAGGVWAESGVTAKAAAAREVCFRKSRRSMGFNDDETRTGSSRVVGFSAALHVEVGLQDFFTGCFEDTAKGIDPMIEFGQGV